MTTINTKTLTAVMTAFRAEAKAAKKTSAALEAYAVECMDGQIKRADAAKALAERLAKELKQDVTSLKALDRSIENKWTYICNKLGYSADAKNASKGRAGGKAKQATATGKQKGNVSVIPASASETTTRPGTDKTKSVIDHAAALKETVKNTKVMREIASVVGTLESKQRVATAKMFLDTLTAAEMTALLADYNPAKKSGKKAA